MPLNPRPPIALLLVALAGGVLLTRNLGADERDRLEVGLQADGRIVVPTNQILKPAGKQVLFPGRPVDLALTDEGRTLVVKNLKDLVFIDAATGEVKQTLASPVGFSVVGLLAHERARLRHRRQGPPPRRLAARRTARYAWDDPVALKTPRVGGSAHPAGIARQSDEALWVTSTRGNNVQLIDLADGKVRAGGRRRRGPLRGLFRASGPLLRHQLGRRPAEGGGPPGRLLRHAGPGRFATGSPARGPSRCWASWTASGGR